MSIFSDLIVSLVIVTVIFHVESLVAHFKYFAMIVVFSIFFLFFEKIPIVVVRDVCPSVRPSVCVINSFRGNLISSKPIDLKIGLNVR